MFKFHCPCKVLLTFAVFIHLLLLSKMVVEPHGQSVYDPQSPNHALPSTARILSMLTVQEKRTIVNIVT